MSRLSTHLEDEAQLATHEEREAVEQEATKLAASFTAFAGTTAHLPRAVAPKPLFPRRKHTQVLLFDDMLRTRCMQCGGPGALKLVVGTARWRGPSRPPWTGRIRRQATSVSWHVALGLLLRCAPLSQHV